MKKKYVGDKIFEKNQFYNDLPILSFAFVEV